MTLSLPPAVRAALAELSGLSRTQASLRLVVALTPLLVLALAHVAGATWSTPVAVVVLVLSLAAAVEPDSHLAMVVLWVLGWFWLARVPQALSVWTLLAAVIVLVFHATAALSATEPPAATLPRVTLLRWGRRTLAVAAVTTLLWGLARLAVTAHPAGQAALTAAALGVVVVGALALRRTARPPQAAQPDAGRTSVRPAPRG